MNCLGGGGGEFKDELVQILLQGSQVSLIVEHMIMQVFKSPVFKSQSGLLYYLPSH